jgi:hydrogenase small subunit
VYNRRDFLKLCTFMGAGAVVTYYAADIRRVFAQTAEQNGGKVHLIWLLLAGDSGCTVSMLQASNPDLIGAVQDLGISADYWQTFMTPDYDLGWVSAGYTSEINSQVPLMNAAFGDAPVDVLVVEGSPQIGTPPGGSPGDYCKIGQNNGVDVNAYELLQKLAAKASYVVAIGQCSSFGGIPAAKGNLTGAVSVTDALKTAGVTTKNTVINLPGCPAQPDWTLITLASVLQGFSPDLDDLGRPKAFFSRYVHESCPRRGYYDAGQFATNFDDPECLWDLGCKGPITLSACAETKWNGGVGFCTQGGPMCWGCMHPNFPDAPTSGFFEAVPHFPGVDLETLEVAGAAAVVVGAGLAIGLQYKSKKEEKPEKKEVLPQTGGEPQTKESGTGSSS